MIHIKKYFIVLNIILVTILSTSCSLNEDTETFFDKLVSQDTFIDWESINELYDEEDYEAIIYYFEGILVKDDLNVDAHTELGYCYNTIGEPEKALKHFKASLNNGYPDLDVLYNNMSWTYANLFEYDKALDYINKALKLEPNDEIEYMNKSVALVGLERYDEALKCYDEILELNPQAYDAFYNKGTIFFDMLDFNEAINQFNKYLSHVPENIDTYIYLGRCYYGLEEYEKALEYINEVLENDPLNYDAINDKGAYYEAFNDYDKAIEQYLYAIEMFEDYYDAYYNLGYAYYMKYDYVESNKYFERGLEIYPYDLDTYLFLIYNNVEEEDFDTALKWVDKGFEYLPDSVDIINAKGNVYYTMTEYIDALEQYYDVIEKDDTYIDAYINILDTLYAYKRYDESLQKFDEFSSVLSNNPTAYIITANNYSMLNKYDKAIEMLEKAYNIENNEDTMVFLGYAHFYNYDYKKALEAANVVLLSNPENLGALELKNVLTKYEEPVANQIMEFIDENYLYSEQVNEEKVDEISQASLKELSDINKYLIDFFIDKDYFSYFIYGEEYDKYINEEEIDTIYYTKLDGDIHYFYISMFNGTTANEFINIIDTISTPEDEHIILDMRQNPGGAINAGLNILDVLLPRVSLCTLIDRDGYEETYESDAEMVNFENIFIFVDEYSASCSELVSLALKEKADNVTILGRDTFGKGVGQTVYENRQEQFVLALTNFYWYIDNINVMNEIIEPDIYVYSDNTNDFINEVYELIDK